MPFYQESSGVDARWSSNTDVGRDQHIYYGQVYNNVHRGKEQETIYAIVNFNAL